MILIKLKDLDYHLDHYDFEYDSFLVEEDKDFEEKYRELVHRCQACEDFNGIKEFINNNFKRMNYETRTIEV